MLAVPIVIVIVLVVVYLIGFRKKYIKTKTIKIFKSSDAVHLYIAEVQVFNGSGINVALPEHGGSATQSSTSFGWGAERAIDGNTSGGVVHGAVPSLSATGASDLEYWQLTITPQVIKSVTIHNTSGNEVQQGFLEGTKLVFYDENDVEYFSKVLTSEISQTILV